MNFDDIFSSISHELDIEAQTKTQIQELEQEFSANISSPKASLAQATYVSPRDLLGLYGDDLERTKSFTMDLRENVLNGTVYGSPTLQSISTVFQQAQSKLSEVEGKKIQKDAILHRFKEEVFYLLLVERYFHIVAILLARETAVEGTLSCPMVSSPTESTDNAVGIIMTPQELQTVTKVVNFDYSDYLLALLRLTDTIVEFTTNSIIRISISEESKTSEGKIPYSISLLNSKLLTKLQTGFQMLDLKNDNIRRKYDGLKYNVKKVNGVVYDLSLRKLLIKDIEVV